MMNPQIIYVPGALADLIGAHSLQNMADAAAQQVKSVVEVHTYGHSEYHSQTRYIGVLRDA